MTINNHGILAAGLMALAAPVYAQDIQDVGAISRVIDMLCVDLTDHIGCERVILAKTEGEQNLVDLFVLPNFQNRDTTPIVIVGKAFWSAGSFGDGPSPQRAENGSLQIVTEQIGSGRNPWTHTHTIVAMEGELMVGGETFTTYDRIDNSTFACDVNLLTGRYEITGSPPQVDAETGALTSNDVVFENNGRGQPAAYPLADLSYDRGLPEICDKMRQGWPSD